MIERNTNGLAESNTPENCYSCRHAIPIFTDIGTMCCTIEQRMLKAEDGVQWGKPSWCPKTEKSKEK